MTDTAGYSPRHRVERVVSAGRLAVAAFLCLGLLVDPYEPGPYFAVVQAIAATYLIYALVLATIHWRVSTTPAVVPVVTHVVDLVLFSVLMHLSEGPTSPFFVYFIFATLCGAIRWHGPGALLTGAAALVAYGAVTVAGTNYLGTADSDWLRFTTRCAHLATVAGLLAYLGAHQQRLQREIGNLAQWPRRLPARHEDALQELLAYAADTLRAPRVVLVWEEGDEPDLCVASFEKQRFEVTRERPDIFGELVTQPVGDCSFLCNDVSQPTPRALLRCGGPVFSFATGPVLDPRFRERYTVRSVLGLRLVGDTIKGWLFALDGRVSSADDLLLGDIVGGLVTSALDLQVRVAQLREAAATDERLRLARDLHDGVLQTLTAAALQLQRARVVLQSDPAGAERRLDCLQDIIYSEQVAMRHAVETLNPRHARAVRSVSAAAALRECIASVSRQWELRVQLRVPDDDVELREPVVHEICRMVGESLVNAARHGAAREAIVECRRDNRSVALAVEYEGHGFPGLQGRHDLDALDALGQGPRMLKQRVAALGGSLVLESSERGARLEIVLPVADLGA